MTRDSVTTERLASLIERVISLTTGGEIHWERQVGSAHRYARWKNNLLILGPAEPLSDTLVSRYLFVTPFDSPTCIEVNSADRELGQAVVRLVAAVEQASSHEPPTDPFAITDDILSRLS